MPEFWSLTRLGGAVSSRDMSKYPQEDIVTVASHPLGIKPSGNAYTAQKNVKSATGRLCFLPDEILVQILEFLDTPSLKAIGGTCKALYAFSRLDEIWKTICIE